MSLTDTTVVGGEVAEGFEPVREAFESLGAEAGDGGYAYAAYWRGSKVVDLWTGRAGDAAWDAQTMPLWMSVTKAMTALCVQILWDRDVLDVDRPVAEYWPEFAANGKQAITVADVLTHRGGLLGAPELTALISLEDGSGLDRPDEIAAILAAAAPVWEPGTKTGYHTLTYGWILGEVIRRVDGRDLGAFFAEEVAGPLGADATIGVDPQDHGRIPTIHPNMWPEAMPEALVEYSQTLFALARDPATPAGISCLARDGVGALDRIPELFNNAVARTVPLGGSNLAGNAASVARIFAAIAEPEGLDGVELVSRRSVEHFTAVRNEAPDEVLLMPIPRALGYWTNKQMGRPQSMGPNEPAFGHTGAGGQIGFADPVARVGAGFVRSHYTVFPIAYLLLNAALYRCIDAAG